jgi:hypothetical protein
MRAITYKKIKKIKVAEWGTPKINILKKKTKKCEKIWRSTKLTKDGKEKRKMCFRRKLLFLVINQ